MSPRICLALGAALLIAQPAVGADAETEVLAAEKSWVAAVLARDVPALDGLLHDDMFYAHSTGTVESKEQYLGNFESGAVRYDVIDHEKTTVTLHGDTAIAHSTVSMKGEGTGGPFDAYLMMIHVWVHGAEGWQLAAHQTTRLTRP